MLRYFSQYGEVIDCVVMKNPQTGKSRGFGFVKFRDLSCVDVVLSSGPHMLDGRQVTLLFSARSDSGCFSALHCLEFPCRVSFAAPPHLVLTRTPFQFDTAAVTRMQSILQIQPKCETQQGVPNQQP